MKHVVLCVTGSIAAYKAIDLTSQLTKQKDISIDVILTENAAKFVQPLSFESLTRKKAYVDEFSGHEGEIAHIDLASKADLLVMVPADANTIAKVVHGIADNMLTSTWLASTAKKLICPAMNTHMYENPVTQSNLKKAKDYGMYILDPADGHLACGTSGKGKLASVDDILEEILYLLSEKPLLGKKVLISAGPTKEAIDPVRYITNHSSGKMGYAIAKNAARMGAEVTLVSGPVNLDTPSHVTRIDIKSSADMANAILTRQKDFDYIIMSAAIADYTPISVASQKIKKNDGDFSIPLKRTIDILQTLGQNRTDKQVICGFAMETENLIENAQKKLAKKNCDMIVANSLTTAGAGFGVDTNVATLITKNGNIEMPLMSKEALGYEILLKMKQMEEEKC